MLTFLITGFVLGITSSLHCMGMCGPIAMALPLNRRSTGTILFGAFQYNFGRVLTYSILGIIVGSVGLTIHTFGFLQWTSIIAGALLILFAWRKLFSRIPFLHMPTLFFNSGLNTLLGKTIRSKNPAKLIFLGGLNGLLPCGMVYVALLNAILAGNPYSSALAMIAFGLGTLPAMIFVSVAFSKITNDRRKAYQKVLPYLLTVVGLLIILRGMNLDIPYLSPKISISNNQKQDQPAKTEVEMSCCHKNQACE
ncbi:sulfite exporter TauE/SafE family protein [Crocinitomicaceae bacterium]|nr:sulfite exporter TauE/SafE family protein [Crocinitomicaceae bacterium]